MMTNRYYYHKKPLLSRSFVCLLVRSRFSRLTSLLYPPCVGNNTVTYMKNIHTIHLNELCGGVGKVIEL